MKKLLFLNLIFLAIIMLTSSKIIYSNGIAGYTNSPGENTCNACHVTYPLNSPNGNCNITVSGNTTGNYIPGQTYTISINVKKTGALMFGFGCEVLDTNGISTGTLALINTSNTILINTQVGGKNRQNATHYGGVFTSDSCTFSFKWTASSSYSGNISIYAAANAANGDGVTYGDYIYTNSLVLTPDLSTYIDDRNEAAVSFFITPNPNNGNFQINYFIEQNAVVSLRLLSSNGKISTNLFLNRELPGQYKKNISLNNLIPPGIYFLELQIDNNRHIKKILIQ